jgi:hypothetical protein
MSQKEFESFKDKIPEDSKQYIRIVKSKEKTATKPQGSQTSSTKYTKEELEKEFDEELKKEDDE